jgi:TrmH family RNA methyltransferase
MKITSGQNPKIKQLLSLRDRKERDASGLFLIEGFRELERAVRGGVQLEALFICPELFLGTNEEDLIRRAQLTPYELPPFLFEKISYRDRPDGLIAIAHQMKHRLGDLKVGKMPLFVIAESIEKPGNLGTILRSADGAGVDGVIVASPRTDIYNPNTVRASVGTLFTQPVVMATSEETLAFLKERGITVVAAMPEAQVTYTDADFRQPLAIVVGTEQIGLSSLWTQKASLMVRIPMHGVADSLNVGVAAALLLYEVVRQRARG